MDTCSFTVSSCNANSKMSLCLVTTLLNSLPFSSNLSAKAPPYILGLIAIASHSSIALEFEKPKSTVNYQKQWKQFHHH